MAPGGGGGLTVSFWPVGQRLMETQTQHHFGIHAVHVLLSCVTFLFLCHPLVPTDWVLVGPAPPVGNRSWKLVV